MPTDNKLNVYFPIQDLNPQGWVSRFITPVLAKTGQNRSNLTNLIYDTYISKENMTNLEKIGFNQKEIDEFKIRRASVGDEKTIFLNGNFLDKLEVIEPLRDSTLEEKELIAYTKFMSTIKPAQQTFLQAYIKLQYGFRANKQEDFTWVDFPFTQKFNKDYILGPTNPRSEGCGIDDVSTYNQLNIATHINSKIDIRLFFANMQILTQEMDENGTPIQKKINTKFPYGFSFLKLVANLDQSKEAIRLEYGRKVALGFEDVFKDRSLKDIIERREKKVYLLAKQTHNFSFEETGTINLGITYLNWHEELMGKANNVAIPAPTARNSQNLDLPLKYGKFLEKYKYLNEKIKELEEKLQQVKSSEETEKVNKSKSEEKNLLASEIKKQLEEANKNLNLIKRSIKTSLTTVFLDQIKAQGQLFGVNFNTIKKDKEFKIKTNIFLVSPLKEKDGDFKTFFSYEDSYNVDQFLKDGRIPEKYKDNKKKLEEDLTRIYSRIFNAPYDQTQTNNIKSYGHIMFFPLKALIFAAYDFLNDDEKLEIPYMLFGNVLMKVDNKMCSINIGDLLIETETFQKWYYEKFFKKDRLDYPFGVFIRDIMNDLVPEALFRNRMGFDDKSPTSAVKEVKYYLLNTPSYILKQKIYLDNNEEELKSFSALMSRIPTANPNPLIYYGQISNQTTQVTSPLFSNLGVSEFKFNEESDAAKGIPHIKIGADGGFFKKINFMAHDFSKIRTALAMESLADKGSKYFFFYYQLSIESIGTNMFNYDSVVCVPSNPLGIDTEENDTGIAGYYKVIDIQDNINKNGLYTSTSKADWVFNPRYLNREKEKAVLSPGTSIIIKDSLDVGINSPKNYIFQLLENDINSIINMQAESAQVEENKNVAKKDAEKEKEPEKMNYDREESFKNPTLAPKKDTKK